MKLNLYFILVAILQLQSLCGTAFNHLNLYWHTSPSSVNISVTPSKLTPTRPHYQRKQAINLVIMGSLSPQFLNEYLRATPEATLFTHFNYYSNQNYLNHIRLRSGYEDFITKLHHEIHHNHSFRKSLRGITGFKRKRGFQEFIDHEIKKINEKKSEKKMNCADPIENIGHYQEFRQLCNHFKEQMRTAFNAKNPELAKRYKDRLDAARKTMKNPNLMLDWSNNFDQEFIDHCQYAEFFYQTRGTPLEQLLHNELCATVQNSAYQLACNPNNPQVLALAPIVHEYAAIAAHTKDQRAAFHLSDFCDGLNRLSQGFIDLCHKNTISAVGLGIVTGAGKALYNHFTYALQNPGNVAIDLLIGSVCPPAVALRHAYRIGLSAYQNWDQISEASCQFLAALQKDSYLNPSWLAEHAEGFSELACSIFVAPHVGARIVGCSNISPLAHGLKKQKKIIQACIRNGINITAQKTCDSLKTIFQDARDLLKTESLKPAFAGINDRASLKTIPEPGITPEKSLAKAFPALQSTAQNLADRIRKIDHNILDEMEKIGGHTIERHLNKTNPELIKRGMDLIREAEKKSLPKPKTDHISSFVSKSKAIDVVHESLRNNAEQIAEWMTKNSHEKVKVLEFSHSYKIGRGVVCGKKGSIEEFTKSRIVLKKDPSHKLGFIIISAFPVKEDI